MLPNGLPDLRSGDVGTIAAINGSSASAKRLADMGFVRGACIEMLRPGVPCIVRVAGMHVGLGAAYQEAILLAAG